MDFAETYKLLLNGVEPPIIDAMKQSSTVRSLEPHTYLFEQYSVADAIYLVETGVIMLERSSSAGRRQILAFSYPGDLVGIANEDHFGYSVQSLTPTTLLEFPLAEFTKLTDRSTALRVNLNRIRGTVFTHAINQVYALGQKKAHERVCFLLQEICDRGPSADAELIHLPMTRQDIADYLGLTTETVSRAISRLRSDGVLNVESNHRVRLLQPDVVRQLGDVSGY